MLFMSEINFIFYAFRLKKDYAEKIRTMLSLYSECGLNIE